MRTFPRLVTVLFARALFGCTFLLWIGNLTAREVPFGSLISPGSPAPDGWITSMAVPLTAAAVLILIGAIANGRALIVIGGLAGIGFPAAWLLVNVIGEDLPMGTVGAGLYGALVVGLLTLLIAAVAVDARAPAVR